MPTSQSSANARLAKSSGVADPNRNLVSVDEAAEITPDRIMQLGLGFWGGEDPAQNAFGLLMSLNMLIETKGGFDFTGADCRNWMHEAGFKETRVEPLCGTNSMVIGLK